MARTATAQTAPPTTDTATETVTTEVATATPAVAPNAAALVELREIAVVDIATDGSNPRTLFDLDGEAGLRELAASIKAHGLVQPITVRANLDAGEGAPPYLLVAGERRLRAIRDVLKRRTIAAIMRHDLTEDTALEATILENLQRRDLHPMDRVDITPTPEAYRQIARLFRAQRADATALADRAACSLDVLDATNDADLAPWSRDLLAAAFEALHDAERARVHHMDEGLDALSPYAAAGDGEGSDDAA